MATKHSIGKVYILINQDCPNELYVGGTAQPWCNKRHFRHKEQWKKGFGKSYGNIFNTEGHQCVIVELNPFCGEELRKRERYYYDLFKSYGLKVLNQNIPWKQPWEAIEQQKLCMNRWYAKKKGLQNDLSLQKKLPETPL